MHIHIAWHKMSLKPSIAHHCTAFLTLPDHNMPPIEADATYQGYLSSCDKLHSHSSRLPTVRRYSIKVCVYNLCVKIMQSWDSAHVLCCLWIGCVILRLECNLGILGMSNTISRLCKFSECKEQMYCNVAMFCVLPFVAADYEVLREFVRHLLKVHNTCPLSHTH